METSATVDQQTPRLPSLLQVFYLSLAAFWPWLLPSPASASKFIWPSSPAGFLAFAVGKQVGYKYQDLEKALTGGISNGMDAVIILLAVGALVGTWISGGIVPSLIYYGLKVIHPSIFLLATLIICSLTSIATGDLVGDCWDRRYRHDGDRGRAGDFQRL